MTESKHHQALVVRTATAVQAALRGYSNVKCYIDGLADSDGHPPIIQGYRPDVYAETREIVVVGEAKPPWDLESPRSELQLRAFLRYVETNRVRHMVLAVNWRDRATAKSLLKSIALNWECVRDRIHILDGRYTLCFEFNTKDHAAT